MYKQLAEQGTSTVHYTFTNPNNTIPSSLYSTPNDYLPTLAKSRSAKYWYGTPTVSCQYSGSTVQ